MGLIPFTITGYSPNPQSSQPWGGGGGGSGRTNHGNSGETEYKLSYSEIEKDLTDHPIYLLSCYGPGKDAPVQLFGGEPREVSPEEIRLRFHDLRSQGQQQQAMTMEDQLWRDADQQLQNAKRDISGAISFVKQGANQHPNRIDVVSGNATNDSAPASGPFGQPSKPSTAFGGSANPSDVVFGQPSNSSKSAFGQPSAPSQSAFGQPSGSTFGQPSQPAFGQPSQPTVAFGQPSQSGAAFGQPSQPANPFNPPVKQSSVFGQPSQPAFGQPSKPENPFSQPTQTTIPTFVTSSQPTRSAFGQPSQPSASTFGQPPQSATAPFGQTSKPILNPFGQPSQPTGSTASPSSMTNGTSSSQQPQQQTGYHFHAGAETTKDASGRLLTFKGRPVVYKKDKLDDQVKPYQRLPSGRLQMIYFPEGKTFHRPEDEPPGAEYTPEIEAVYKRAKQLGYFEDGKIPDLPPKREWMSFDL